jgi:hypothetical protein
MKVLIDNKEIEVINSVTIIENNVNEDNTKLHITFNNEGMVADLIDNNDEVVGTYWKTYEDLIPIKDW